MHPQQAQRVPRNLEQHRRTALAGKQRHPNHLTQEDKRKSKTTKPVQSSRQRERGDEPKDTRAALHRRHTKAQSKGKHPQRKPWGIPEEEQTDSKPGGEQDTEDPNGTDPQSKPTRGGAQSNTPGKVRQQGSQPQQARKDRKPGTTGSERDGG